MTLAPAGDLTRSPTTPLALSEHLLGINSGNICCLFYIFLYYQLTGVPHRPTAPKTVDNTRFHIAPSAVLTSLTGQHASRKPTTTPDNLVRLERGPPILAANILHVPNIVGDIGFDFVDLTSSANATATAMSTYLVPQ
ncbi:hypothetical protein FRB90_003190 [Tulasnella sp. 427]|nr:hypothetical protein FRB90_003190 [Tulasnella sp. 427]